MIQKIYTNHTLRSVPSVEPEPNMSFDQFSKSMFSTQNQVFRSPKIPELQLGDASKHHRLNHEKEHVMSCMSCANFMHKWKVTHDYGRKEGHGESCTFCAHMHSVCKRTFVIPPYTTYDYCQYTNPTKYESSDTEMVDEEYNVYAKLDEALLDFEFEVEIDALFEVEPEVTRTDVEVIEVNHDMTNEHHISYCQECTKAKYANIHSVAHPIINEEHVKYCDECTFDNYNQPLLKPFANRAHGFDFSQWHLDRCQYCTHFAQQLKREGRFEAVAEKINDISDY